jgi:hypothetical protein
VIIVADHSPPQTLDKRIRKTRTREPFKIPPPWRRSFFSRRLINGERPAAFNESPRVIGLGRPRKEIDANATTEDSYDACIVLRFVINSMAIKKFVAHVR